MNSKATIARDGDRPRMQIRNYPFARREMSPDESIFLIAIKAMANQRHRGRNCPCAELKFKSLFYKGKSFSPGLKCGVESREEQREKGKHSKEHFQKKVLASRCYARERESRKCRASHMDPAEKFRIPRWFS